MRTTLSISDDVLIAARQLAAAQQRSIGDVISDLARRGLRGERRVVGDDLPAFELPADAPPFDAELVQRALDEA